MYTTEDRGSVMAGRGETEKLMRRALNVVLESRDGGLTRDMRATIQLYGEKELLARLPDYIKYSLIKYDNGQTRANWMCDKRGGNCNPGFAKALARALPKLVAEDEQAGADALQRDVQRVRARADKQQEDDQEEQELAKLLAQKRRDGAAKELENTTRTVDAMRLAEARAAYDRLKVPSPHKNNDADDDDVEVDSPVPDPPLRGEDGSEDGRNTGSLFSPRSASPRSSLRSATPILGGSSQSQSRSPVQRELQSLREQLEEVIVAKKDTEEYMEYMAMNERSLRQRLQLLEDRLEAETVARREAEERAEMAEERAKMAERDADLITMQLIAAQDAVEELQAQTETPKRAPVATPLQARDANAALQMR